ncbi:hypothetical protein OQA88_6563 [Cercophora sp. LCS_1]
MATLPPDPWKALGVDKSADKSEIRSAYKKLVLKCHPDKVQDPQLKAQKQDEFQKVQQAYELLNDDTERTKYEDQVKLMELRKQAAMLAKNMPNSSASRSSPRHYEIRTADPGRKSTTTSSGPKMYPYASVNSRSQEEMPSKYSFEDSERQARRSASYEKTSYREEERRDRDDRRKPRKDDDDFRIQERLREKEKEVRQREKELDRKSERKRTEKERDKDRRSGREDRSRRYNSPYIEENESAEDHYSSSKAEKKRSPSKKPSYETRESREQRERERDKSQASRRPVSPHIETVQPPAPPPPAPAAPEPDYFQDLDKAATYIERSRRQPAGFSASNFVAPPVAPTPPPADPEEDLRAAAIRTAGRRPSHEASKSREKLPSSHKTYVVDASPPKARHIPSLNKSHTVPLAAEMASPPRISRSSTTQGEFPGSLPHMPAFVRSGTWAGHDPEYYAQTIEDSDEDIQRHHRERQHRRSRRGTRSPDPSATIYKVDGNKTTRVAGDGYGYGESPRSARYIPTEVYEAAYPGTYSTSYSGGNIKIKQAPVYTTADVKYADVPPNISYGRDQYQVPA